MPVPGQEPPEIAVVGGVSNSFGSGISKDITNGDNFTEKVIEVGKKRADTSSSTRHARRLYVGNIPRNTRSDEVGDFFNKIISEGLPPNSPDLPAGSQPVINMNILPDKQFGFCEFSSVEISAAVVTGLDGILFTSPSTGQYGNLRINRTNDYDQSKLTNMGPIPTIQVAPELLSKGSARPSGGGNNGGDPGPVGGPRKGPVPDGPGKIFIGGLPYNLGQDEILQVLAAFGEISHFHLIIDRATNMSKGYAFASYKDDSMLSCTNAALMGLNGIQLGEKSLTVKIASSSGGGAAAPPAPAAAAAAPAMNPYGQQPLYAPQQHQHLQQQHQHQPYGQAPPPPLQQQYNPYGQPPAYPPQQQPPQQQQQQHYAPAPAPSMAPAYGMQAPYAYGMPPAPVVPPANPAAAMYGQPAAPAAAVAAAPGASRVLKMSNMVTSEEIQDDTEFADIMEDVRMECSDHGAVLRVLIPRRKENYPAHAEGNIYVEFSDTTGAGAAKRSLAGRKFDNRTVIVEDYPESSYLQGIF